MSNFDADDFLASPMDYLFTALENVSKLELLREIERLKENNARLNKKGVTGEQHNAAKMEAQKELNKQIELNNRLDKQLSFERSRRAQAEKLLDFLIETVSPELLPQDTITSWISWRAEQARQQELG